MPINKSPHQTRDILLVFNTFLLLGLTSFGGPVAHIGYFRRELVVKQQWVSEGQFAQLLALCQFLPGPASSQLGFALGLLRAGAWGAVAAFIAFTLPSFMLLLAFAYGLPLLWGEVLLDETLMGKENLGVVATAVFHGLKLVACVMVADAVFSMARALCPDRYRRGIAMIAVVLLVMVESPWLHLWVILAGALVGSVCCRYLLPQEHDLSLRLPYRKGLSLALLAIFFLLFLLACIPNQQGLYEVAQAFYRAGAMVFGGGHVVLPLLEHSLVAKGWISADDFLTGYGAAQAIPGPLFTFAAYLGALIPSDIGGIYGALAALLLIFLPGFLLLVAVLPLWQRIACMPVALGAIAGVNGAVVGMLAAALYDPILTVGLGSMADLVLVVLALVGLRRSPPSALGPLAVIAWCITASLLLVWL